MSLKMECTSRLHPRPMLRQGFAGQATPGEILPFDYTQGKLNALRAGEGAKRREPPAQVWGLNMNEPRPQVSGMEDKAFLAFAPPPGGPRPNLQS
ncbi:MAG: hypothetical protein ACFFCW_36690 [Candidatus Hodarchaeota archaeon]